jgi:8-oxo-dGTP pyrophosphatase MutT (NUDIX family)
MGVKMIKKWKKINSEIITENKIFKLWQHNCLSPKDGKEYPFLCLDTIDWVNIIPLTKENEVVMIKQYRHGNEENTLEIPGGMTDREDKSPKESALRELVEETGYMGNEVFKLGECSPNPAIFNNLLHVYLVKDVEKKYAQNLENTEDIEIVKIHINKIPDLIKSGEINHALVITAFYYYFNFTK